MAPLPSASFGQPRSWKCACAARSTSNCASCDSVVRTASAAPRSALFIHSNDSGVSDALKKARARAKVVARVVLASSATRSRTFAASASPRSGAATTAATASSSSPDGAPLSAAAAAASSACFLARRASSSALRRSASAFSRSMRSSLAVLAFSGGAPSPLEDAACCLGFCRWFFSVLAFSVCLSFSTTALRSGNSSLGSGRDADEPPYGGPPRAPPP
mmetsp:Transcript_9047/g.37248  ORF Transcript_9047/g.37248 Transcript_9047/m.37248 type:complete len:218 (+) Transcript_9047:201-854(+)